MARMRSGQSNTPASRLDPTFDFPIYLKATLPPHISWQSWYMQSSPQLENFLSLEEINVSLYISLSSLFFLFL